MSEKNVIYKRSDSLPYPCLMEVFELLCQKTQVINKKRNLFIVLKRVFETEKHLRQDKFPILVISMSSVVCDLQASGFNNG